ncbi:MAG: Prokaryotic metallothionein [Campylobacteraceae bacterium]|nr:Prokaryotic metallothionein [Campylobacteraceae bacterium]
MILKILLLLCALALVYLFFFKLSRGNKSNHNNRRPKMQGETMIECATCKTFVSDKDTIIKDGQFFCSRECAKV